MGCSSCAVSKDGVPTGCGDKGHCTSGTCNKLNTTDWLTTLELDDPMSYPIAEVSFKKGTRKAFFLNHPDTRSITGDMVVVEAANGYDVGRITLSGDLVRLQMKKKKVAEERIIHNIIRKANERDLRKLSDARGKEKPTLIKSRQLARTLGLDMKIGEVEYQGDIRKATFYYIADGRVDFRELVRVYAREFRVKIEMRQIGSRQESGLIGGVGACGRELCCSTWLSDFSSVTTTAARYQNIAINQTKLSGQCGRLKCCLNFELNMYVEALDQYPQHIDRIKVKAGNALLMKVDIFSKRMFYSVPTEIGRSKVVALTKEQVLDYKKKNDDKIYPETLMDAETLNLGNSKVEEEKKFADVTGEIVLPEEKRKKRGKKRVNKKSRSASSRSGPRDKKDDRSGSSRSSSRSNQGSKSNKSPKGSGSERPSGNRGNNPTKKTESGKQSSTQPPRGQRSSNKSTDGRSTEKGASSKQNPKNQTTPKSRNQQRDRPKGDASKGDAPKGDQQKPNSNNSGKNDTNNPPKK